jgi:hypothetical protein
MNCISKTDYVLWRECPKNAWLKLHRPDVYNATGLTEFEPQRKRRTIGSMPARLLTAYGVIGPHSLIGLKPNDENLAANVQRGPLYPRMSILGK